MSENNLQPTQMSGAKQGERKVVCRWCGGEMHGGADGSESDQGTNYFYACYNCMALSPSKHDKEAAYLAATRTPPAVEPTELDGMIAHCDEVIGGLCDTNPCRADHVRLRAALVELKTLRTAAAPPNLPLTRKQVEAMPHIAAIWYVTDSCTLVLIERAVIVRDFWHIYKNDLLFAAPPTPEDIAAARAGKGEGNA